MIELSENELFESNRNSSKGNQLKWKRDGIWYKADYTGYEGLSEYLVSHLLTFSNLNPDDYIIYETEEIKYNNTTFLGCKSKDFLDRDSQLITLERLFKNQRGVSLNSMIWKTPEESRAAMIVDETEKVADISNFGKYFLNMMAIDALFLNEDRHTHNIALVEKNGRYSPSPVFDNGASLLSDTTIDFPLGMDIYELIPLCKAKTFNRDFSEQLASAEENFGAAPHFTFNYKEVTALLEKEKYYPDEIKKRVLQIIMEQRRKYIYMFV